MTNKEVASELEKLRAEVAALQQAKQANQSSPHTPEPPVQAKATSAEANSDQPQVSQQSATEPPMQSVGDGTNEAEPVEPAEEGTQLGQKLEELYQLAEQEFKELPVMPTLAIFTVGILLGRFLK